MSWDDQAMGFAGGRPVSIADPDRGEGSELSAILAEFGYGEDWIEQQVESRCDERAVQLLKVFMAYVLFPESGTTREQAIVVVGYVLGVAGLPSMGKAATHFKLGGMSKQSLSIRCKKLGKELNLPPSIYMKSVSASETYRRTNKRRQA